MKTLEIDIECFSKLDLAKCGVYRYAEELELLLFGYSADGGDVRVVDITGGEKLPAEVREALLDPGVEKWAHNASFERVCLSRFLGVWLKPDSWYCTMVWAATLGLPLSLKGVGSVIGIDKQKLDEGKELISYFCKPCNPTKANGSRERNLPTDNPEKWEKFKTYNKRDVEAEMEIRSRMAAFPVRPEEWDNYHLSEEINDRGIGIDMVLAREAIRIHKETKAALTGKARALTLVENPDSVSQMKEWLAAKGMEVVSLGKKDVEAMLKTAAPEVREVLELRLQLAKSSVKKYEAMMNAVCEDGRARGMFMFYGASRTGRFASRIIQFQNLYRNSMTDLAEARSLVKSGDYAALEMLYDIPDTLSQLVRTALVPQHGRKFIVADFSAIEARVLSWLAGETWRMEAFAQGEDIYCATASRMFHCKVVKHGENGELRQKGKSTELGCGFGGSVGALKKIGALESGMKEEELQPLVDAWREANPNIVKLWRDVDLAARKAVGEKKTVRTHSIRFFCQSGFLFVTLPSGRKLAYVKPKIGMNRFGKETITYEGTGATKNWERLETWGGKLVENLCQAVARDILCYAMQNLRHLDIVAHVHDEVIIECDKNTKVETVCELMSKTPPWASGLLLKAEGYECDFYMKD